jgi:hypothetical protein
MGQLFAAARRKIGGVEDSMSKIENIANGNMSTLCLDVLPDGQDEAGYQAQCAGGGVGEALESAPAAMVGVEAGVEALDLGLTAPASTLPPSDTFDWGVSIDFGMEYPTGVIPAEQIPTVVANLKALKVEYVRFEIPMKESLDILSADGTPNLNNEVFATIDAIRAAGIQIVPVIGVGGRKVLPDGLTVNDPKYIEKVSKNVSDIVAALSQDRIDPSGRQIKGVTTFQIENELNAAGLATLPIYGWRQGDKWFDPEFKKDLISSLENAARTANPEVPVTLYSNFHDLISDPIPAVQVNPLLDFPLPNGWTTGQLQRLAMAILNREENVEKGVKNISPHIDKVGLDFYPNYVFPREVTEWLGLPADFALAGGALGTSEVGELLKQRVARYREITGKDVLVAETGYPSSAPSGHNQFGQAAFAKEIAEAARESGAVGLTYFRFHDPKPREDGTNPLDPKVTTEPYFGLLDANLRAKLSFAAYQGVIGRNPGDLTDVDGPLFD